MNTATGRGSWDSQPHSLLNRDDDDDDDDSLGHTSQLPVAAAKENLHPEKSGKDMSKVAATVASQLLCELAMELD